jgi:long-chain acyl-CoA synthetase
MAQDQLDEGAYPDWPNLASLMFSRARDWPDRPMLRFYRDDGWRSMTWGSFGRLAAAAARSLRAAGIAPGDRVLIASENRPEFPIAETALLAIGAVPVPAYVTNTVDDHAHVLRDSGARVAIASTAALAAKVAEAGPLDLLVHMDPGAPPMARSMQWAELVASADQPADDIAAAAEQIPKSALACLIYTSGTGGAPKGVMLAHRAILANCRGAFELVRPLRLRRETYLSFLPLSHSYEHTAGQFFLLSIGTEVAYARGAEHLAADMLAVRPTIMTVVPRVLDVIHGRIMAQVNRGPAWRRALFHRAVALGTTRSEGGHLTVPERVADWALEHLVRRRVRARFGGRFRAAMSGGARLEPEVGRFFRALGIALMQGYGQTEAGPVISANAPDATRIDTVGKPLPGVELCIAEDGEILVRGDLVMDGYWNRPDDTRAVLRDGWLHTGDVGVLEPDGNLRITDRKRDLIVLSGGENVAPARIEGLLAAEPAIAQAVVFGEGRPGLAALVVPAQDADEVAVAAAVAQVNKRLAVTERIRRHAVVGPFTIENGLLTATQKVRRHLALQTHAAVAERLMAG